MILNPKYFVFLVFLLSIGCASESIPKSDSNLQKQMLVGKWYGNQLEENGDIYAWVIERKANGEYSLHNVSVNKQTGAKEESSHSGTWRVENDIYSSKTEILVEGGNTYEVEGAEFSNHYKIKHLEDMIFEYEHTEGLGSFSVVKVEDDFDLMKALEKTE